MRYFNFLIGRQSVPDAYILLYVWQSVDGNPVEFHGGEMQILQYHQNCQSAAGDETLDP